jgi:hypothetical protein
MTYFVVLLILVIKQDISSLVMLYDIKGNKLRNPNNFRH